MDINKPWGYWVSIFLNCTPIISDSTQRIFPPPDHGGIPSILFGILYYSNKSKLSSFGSVKGWPVLAHALCTSAPQYLQWQGTWWSLLDWVVALCEASVSLSFFAF